ncbi:MAG: cytochrome c peroxidase [Ferruginibacter sp.]
MKKFYVAILLTGLIFITLASFRHQNNAESYSRFYFEKLNGFKESQAELLKFISLCDLSKQQDIKKVKMQINDLRLHLKGMDFWLRYLEPVMYKKINGPLPVEWETEVFEKFEKPYKREGAGVSLATLYLDEENINRDSLSHLIESSLNAMQTFAADSITKELKNYHHFFLANRLFLLNLASIYTTGFECPDTERIVPELRFMLKRVNETYQVFNESFPNTALKKEYHLLYEKMIDFTDQQPIEFSGFDHFNFIKNYVNPLFALNQQMIAEYKVYSKSYMDYTLNKNANTIFNKALYSGQNTKGIFLRVKDEKALAEIDHLGKLLFYDPILSGNNLRSCASCHKPSEYFTDTTLTTSYQFNNKDFLPRNSPSLINSIYNHLIMLDGKHISLQQQSKDVITNATELGSEETAVMNKIMSCNEYKEGFEKLLALTPQETEITFEHIISAITFHYGKFSNYTAPFDDAINENKALPSSVKEGFNIFMSKAQCGTCHFVPQFNGVKPPYVSSEFEVLGVPEDTGYKKLSDDKGRYNVSPSGEMLHAFRTGSIRNALYTKPYMHNGIFTTLEEVVDFYDAGGGVGKGLKITNQTLSADSLHLSADEKIKLISFIESLNENIPFEEKPHHLPTSTDSKLINRKVGGTY